MWFKTDKQPQKCPLWATMSSAMPRTLSVHNGHFLRVYLNHKLRELEFSLDITTV